MKRLTLQFIACVATVMLTSCEKPQEIEYSKLAYDGVNTFLDPATKKGFTGIAHDRYPDGKPKAEFSFKNGLMHGTVTEWYPNGKKKAETVFDSGERCGKNSEWNESGSLFQERVYDHDRIVSEKKYGADK